MEDAIADIATAFHWPPESMYKMSIEELMDYREAARVRFQPEDKKGK